VGKAKEKWHRGLRKRMKGYYAIIMGMDRVTVIL